MTEPGSMASPAGTDASTHRLRHMPLTVALIYVATGVLWIFLTDRLLLWFDFDGLMALRLQTTKGWLFMVVSAIVIYLLLRRYERAAETATQALVHSKDEVRRMNTELEQRVAARTRQLESANRELEAFAYAVSHDLRAPLRSMSGFSQILQETAPAGLDERSLDYLRRIREASLRMSTLIDDLLGLSRIGRSELVPRAVDLTQIATDAAATIRDRYPDRTVALKIEPGMNSFGDPRLLRIAFENLLDNAWKYTANAPHAEVVVGSQPAENGPAWFVRDNGVGFDMAYSSKLFAPFQRLHPESEFPGTGIGLVTVQRIITRHGGRIWAEAHPGQGATFHFTLDAQ